MVLTLLEGLDKINPSFFVFATEWLSNEFLERGALASLKIPFIAPEIQILSQAILNDVCSSP